MEKQQQTKKNWRPREAKKKLKQERKNQPTQLKKKNWSGIVIDEYCATNHTIVGMELLYCMKYYYCSYIIQTLLEK